MLGGVEFIYVPKTAEDGMRTKVHVPEDHPNMIKGMYYQAALRVTVENCLRANGL